MEKTYSMRIRCICNRITKINKDNSQKKDAIILYHKERILLSIIFLMLCFFVLLQIPNSVFASNATSTVFDNSKLNIEKKEDSSLREKYEFFVSTAKRFKEAQKHEFAIGFFRKALNIKPNQVGIIKEIGLSYMATGDFKESIKYFDKALELNPKNEEIENYKNDAIWLLDAVKGNVPDKRHKIPLQGSTIDGIRLYYDGKYQEATEQFQESLKKIPYDIKALTIGGHAFVELGKYQEAVNFYDRALNLEPTSILLQSSKNNALSKMQTQPILQKNNDKQLSKNYEIKTNSTDSKTNNLQTTKISGSKKDYIETKIEESTILDSKYEQTSESVVSSDMLNQKKVTKTGNNENQKPDTTIQERDSNKKVKSELTIKDLPAKTATCLKSFCFLKSESDLQIGPKLNYIIVVSNKTSIIENNKITQIVELDNNILSDLKKDTKLWTRNQISDEEFLLSVQVMLNNFDEKNYESEFKSAKSLPYTQVPKWVKKASFLWISNNINDGEFVMMLKWLYENGVFSDIKKLE